MIACWKKRIKRGADIREPIEKTISSDRIYSIDTIRICATICIICHHYQQWYQIRFDRGINYYYGRFYFGYVVELFFMLSGLLATRSIRTIANKSLKDYIAKKYLRLVPVAFISVITYHLIQVFAAHYNADIGLTTNQGFGKILISALCIYDGKILKNFGINYPMWYIGVLIVCFVFLYVVIWICTRLKIKASCGFAIMVLVGAVINLFSINQPLLNEDTSRGLMSFFVGGLLSQLYKREKEIKKWQTSICLITAIIIVWVIVKEKYFNTDEIQFLLIFLLYPSLITLSLSNVSRRIFNHRIIGEMGKITYDVYVWHDVINLIIYVNAVKNDMNIPHSRIVMWIFACFCFAIGAVSYYKLEVPLWNITRRITDNL